MNGEYNNSRATLIFKNCIYHCVLIMLFNYYKDFKGERLFSLLLSGVQKAGRTHCDHCHRNEFPRGPDPIRAQLCAPLNRAVQNHANHFPTSSCATFHRAQKESRHSCPQQCARPSFCLEERPEKIEFTLLFFRSLLLLEI